MSPFKVSKEILINAPVNKVWNALTDPEIIKQYMFGSEVICDWSPGSPILFRGVYQGTAYEDKGVILACDVEQRLEYTYFSSFSDLEDKPENYSRVNFGLSGMDDGETTLTLCQENLASREAAEHSDAGWGQALSMLKEIVEGSL